MQKRWSLLPDPPQSFIDEHPELPPIVAKLLFHRNILTAEQIDEFLNMDYVHHVHDPFLFKDMPKTVERIFTAIQNKEKIIVHGDYDADGVSASVILVSTLKALGAEHVGVFLPHRETDGYGLNTNTIQKLADEKTNLIITCDCGISNIEEVKMANELGMDVIITDHHTVPEIPPPAFAIIHPKTIGETYPDKGLAGGAVAFKLMQGLLKEYSKTHETLPNSGPLLSFEKWLLDMVAIASVADMVPLIGESRTLTKFGLIVLNKTRRIGLQKLLLEARITDEQGGCKHPINTETIGFQIAPRINAAGRMNHANVAYNLMMTESATDAVDLAFELDQNNQERQKMTEGLVKKAIEQVEKDQKNNPMLFVLGQQWSSGIVGLIAGKIKEKYYKPTIVMVQNGNEIMGSGRSIEGFNLIESLQELSHFFSKFGGHPMACGFTLKDSSKLELFKNSLMNLCKQKTDGKLVEPTILIDAEIDLDEVDWELYNTLAKFEPFGQMNESPKYLAKGLTIQSMKALGKDSKHLRIMVKHNNHRVRKTIGWNLCNGNGNNTNWCNLLKPGDVIDMVFEISLNEWNGTKELQMTIVDLKKQ